ncbi:MAG: Crp/Fnr family transcriptional regulator, partial [Dolichospermum sp.]
MRQDEVCRHSFTIEEGVLRKSYLYDGKEITTEFFFKDDLAISFDSYSLQKPSKEFIQALTDTTVSQTDFTAFQNAKIDFPKLVELDLFLTEYYAIWLENRLFEFHTLDATQRYLLLLKQQSHIIQNIPLTYIAS